MKQSLLIALLGLSACQSVREDPSAKSASKLAGTEADSARTFALELDWGILSNLDVGRDSLDIVPKFRFSGEICSRANVLDREKRPTCETLFEETKEFEVETGKFISLDHRTIVEADVFASAFKKVDVSDSVREFYEYFLILSVDVKVSEGTYTPSSFVKIGFLLDDGFFKMGNRNAASLSLGPVVADSGFGSSASLRLFARDRRYHTLQQYMAAEKKVADGISVNDEAWDARLSKHPWEFEDDGPNEIEDFLMPPCKRIQVDKFYDGKIRFYDGETYNTLLLNYETEPEDLISSVTPELLHHRVRYVREDEKYSAILDDTGEFRDIRLGFNDEGRLLLTYSLNRIQIGPYGMSGTGRIRCISLDRSKG